MAKRKRKRKAEEPIKADMTPMIDVTFQLLIFFMLTIEFKTLEGKLAAYLPKDVGVNTSEAEPKEKIEIKIKVITDIKPIQCRGNNSSDVGKTDFLIKKSSHANLVGGVKHSRFYPAIPHDIEGELQSRKTIIIRFFKTQVAAIGQAEPGKSQLDPLWIGQGIGNGDTHIRDPQLRNH